MKFLDFTTENLMLAGAHYGHHMLFSDSRSFQIFSGHKNGMSFLDLSLSLQRLKYGLAVAAFIAKKRGRFLFVNPDFDSLDFLQDYLYSSYLNFTMTLRKLPGVLSNHSALRRFLTDKNGRFLPHMAFIFHVQDHYAVREAANLKVPYVALFDSNSNAALAAFYNVPSSDDSVVIRKFHVQAIFKALRSGFTAFIKKWLRYRNLKAKLFENLSPTNIVTESGLGMVYEGQKRIGSKNLNQASKVPQPSILKLLYARITSGLASKESYGLVNWLKVPHSLFVSVEVDSDEMLLPRISNLLDRVSLKALVCKLPLRLKARLCKINRRNGWYLFEQRFTVSSLLDSLTTGQRILAQRLSSRKVKRRRARLNRSAVFESNLQRRERNEIIAEQWIKLLRPSLVLRLETYVSSFMRRAVSKLDWFKVAKRVKPSFVSFTLFGTKLLRNLAICLFLTTEIELAYRNKLIRLNVFEFEHLRSFLWGIKKQRYRFPEHGVAPKMLSIFEEEDEELEKQANEKKLENEELISLKKRSFQDIYFEKQKLFYDFSKLALLPRSFRPRSRLDKVIARHLARFTRTNSFNFGQRMLKYILKLKNFGQFSKQVLAAKKKIRKSRARSLARGYNSFARGGYKATIAGKQTLNVRNTNDSGLSRNLNRNSGGYHKNGNGKGMHFYTKNDVRGSDQRGNNLARKGGYDQRRDGNYFGKNSYKRNKNRNILRKYGYTFNLDALGLRRSKRNFNVKMSVHHKGTMVSNKNKVDLTKQGFNLNKKEVTQLNINKNSPLKK